MGLQDELQRESQTADHGVADGLNEIVMSEFTIGVHGGALLDVSGPNGVCMSPLGTNRDDLRRKTMGLQDELQRETQTADHGVAVGLSEIRDVEVGVHGGALLVVSDTTDGWMSPLGTNRDDLRRKTMGLQDELQRETQTADHGVAVGLSEIRDVEVGVHGGALLVVSDTTDGWMSPLGTNRDDLRRKTMGLQDELQRETQTADHGVAVGLSEIRDVEVGVHGGALLVVSDTTDGWMSPLGTNRDDLRRKTMGLQDELQRDTDTACMTRSTHGHN